MPLTNSASMNAFHQNMKKEMGAGKKLAQALAIAYSVQRKAKKKKSRKKK